MHVEPVADVAPDEACRLELSIPPAMDCLGTRPLLRVRADSELLLALGTTTVADLLGGVEEVVIRLGWPADVGEVRTEKEPEPPSIAGA